MLQLHCFNARIIATLLLLCSFFVASELGSIAAAAPPALTCSLSDERIVAGEPLFLRYKLTNSSATTAQLLWTGEKPHWVTIHILDAENKDAAPVTYAPISQFEEGMIGYRTPVRYEPSVNETMILNLKPGKSFTNQVTITEAAAKLSKPGVYHIEARFNYRLMEMADGDPLNGFTEPFKRQIKSGFMFVAKDAMPDGLLLVEKGKTIRLVVTATDEQALKKRAKQLQDSALHGSVEEKQDALEKLGGWPASTALEVWTSFVQEDMLNSQRSGRTVPGDVHDLVLQVIQKRNPAMLSFLEDLTWKSKAYDAHQTYEALYVNGNEATRKTILSLYSKHNEEFPARPSNY